MEAIENVRLNSDATLKGTNELRLDFVEMKSKLASQSEKINDLERRLDKAQTWLMTVVAAMVVFGLQQIFTVLRSLPHP